VKLPRLLRGGFGGAGPSEKRAATSNSTRGPMSPELMVVAASDGRRFDSPRLHHKPLDRCGFREGPPGG